MRRSSATTLLEDDQIDVVKWLLQHLEGYVDGRRNSGNNAQSISRTNSQRHTAISTFTKWIETWKEQVEQIAGSGVALADTDWKQVLDEWIEFLGDLEAERQGRRLRLLKNCPLASRLGVSRKEWSQGWLLAAAKRNRFPWSNLQLRQNLRLRQSRLCHNLLLSQESV